MSRHQANCILTSAAKRANIVKVHPKSEKAAPAWPHTFPHGAAKHQLEQTLLLDYV